MISEKRKNRIRQVVERRQRGLTVVLEDMYDPHNAAAVLRSCDAFGVQDVYFIFQYQKPFNPRKIGKLSSASANKWLDFHIFTSPSDCINTLKVQGFTTYATMVDEQAQSLYKTSFAEENIALVFGNEHTGITKELATLCDKKIYLPMRGFVESFNLSVTASMLLFEVTRQRLSENALNPLSANDQLALAIEFEKR